MARKYSGYSNIVSGKTLDPYAAALIARMTAAGEAPSVEHAAAINTCIVSLRVAGLFETQYDVLVVTRGHGAASTKMNWIGNFCNGTGMNGVTFTDNVGYSGNGLTQYINTNYTPSVNGILYTQDNASFTLKKSGTAINSIQGCEAYTEIGIGNLGGIRINNGAGFFITDAYALAALDGYMSINRMSNLDCNYHYNNSTVQKNMNSVALANIIEFNILRTNRANKIYCSASEINELYALGKSISQVSFLTFQEIFNTYFASI